MEKYEMFDKIIQYQMRGITTQQVSSFLDEYTNFIENKSDKKTMKKIGQIELLHDMQHPFTFLNDHGKYDGSTWLVKIYIFGLALVKQRDRRKWRIVLFSNVKAMITPIFMEHETSED